ncbi:MAG TPA: hypothetical protein VF139_14725 [Candidatus Polarisedimenticolaceae bacterium]
MSLLLAATLLAASAPLRAVVLVDGSAATARDAEAAVTRVGGTVAHRFDGLLLAALDDSGARRLFRAPSIRDVTLGALPRERERGRSEAFRAALRGWNGGAFDPRPVTGAPPRQPEPAHAWVPPVAGTGGGSVTAATSSEGLPYGATPSNTSEYLAGRVAINVLLVESDGTIDLPTESWTAERESAVLASVVAACEWLRLQEPQARLSFDYRLIAGRTDARARTSYEPIRRPADPRGTAGEALWSSEILAKMGHASGDRFARSRALADATRREVGADWGLNVFVADSFADADGRFPDGYYAWTWVGGPHVVATWDNGAWGSARFDQVLRHELLHAFWAFDEYATSGCTCQESRGYLDGRGLNCDACNMSAVPCVMISNGDAMCAHTRRQIGWADLDGDGVIDVAGEDPDTFFDGDAVPASPVCGAVALRGSASVVAPTNRNPILTTPRSSISLARVAAVEWRVDGAPWVPAVPEDGAFDAPVERFAVTVPSGPGSRLVEVRSRDTWSNADPAPERATLEAAAPASDVGDSLRVESGATLAWRTVPGAVAYRVYRAPASPGPWSLVAEVTFPAHGDAVGTDGYFRIRAVDACGREAD